MVLRPNNPMHKPFWIMLLVANLFILGTQLTIGNFGLSAMAVGMVGLAGFELTYEPKI